MAKRVLSPTMRPYGWLWHRFLVRIGLRKETPFVITPQMIVNIALKNLDNNLVMKRLRDG